MTTEKRRPTTDELVAEVMREARIDGERLLHLVNDPECLRALYDLSGTIARAQHPLPTLRATIDCWRAQVAEERQRKEVSRA